MEAVAAQLETKASASNGQYPEVHEDEEMASAKLHFGTQDPTVSEKSDNMVAHYWYNELKSRLAQGDDKARLSPSEINQIMEVKCKLEEIEGATVASHGQEPSLYKKFLAILTTFSNRQKTMTAAAETQNPQQVPKESKMQLGPEKPKDSFMSDDQISMLKNQILTFKFISRNLPVPTQLQQAVLSGLPHDPLVSVTDVQTYNIPLDKHSSDPYAHVRHAHLNDNLHRVLIPSITPRGLDPLALSQERDRVVQQRIQDRIHELEQLPSNLAHDRSHFTPINKDGGLAVKNEIDSVAEDKLKLRRVIELKALKLVEKQRRFRAELINGLKRGSAVASASSPMDYRRVKKPNIRELRFTEKHERQQLLDRERKEQQKHLDYVNTILQHGRDVLGARKLLSLKQLKLGRAIVSWHSTVEKEEQKRQERLTKERIRALKADDEEGYLKLIDKQKDTRLTHLLQQTDTYLETLASLVESQKEDIHSRDASATGPLNRPSASAVAGSAGVPNEFGAANDGAAEENVDYYSIAHKIQEKVDKQPSLLVGGTLKEYQIKGLEWMVSLYNNKLNGLLADEMGLGKTIQAISLVAHLMEHKNQNGPFLIIVPLSTITNWCLEFEKWAPSVLKVVYKGSPNQRKHIQQTELRNNMFNVLLTTYEYIIKDRSVLAKIKWIYTIIDEGHRMKNASSKLSITLTQFYHSRYRLILTGTPLQNNLPELWALLNFVLPRVFNSVRSFDEWFNTPFANTGERIELNEEEQLLIIRRLHKVLRPFLLRRLKKDVEADLPDKTERILKTPLSALQQKLYNQIRISGAMLIGGTNPKGGMGVRSINNTVMQLRKVCNHPFVFPEVEDEMNPRNITDEMIFRVSGKFALLDRILPKFRATGHRVLMFFQMTAVMDIMEDFFRWRGFKYLRLDGSTKTEDRSLLLKHFNAPNSEYFIFILSTRAGGLGLNLQSADTVIIFDSDWNPHQDLQAQDRAHRIGQTKEVRIFRLISANSVEETILARAQYKLDIDGKVIQAGKFDNKSTNEERDDFLRSLFDQNPEEANNIDDVDDDDELNEILARSDSEIDVFKRVDVEKDAELEMYWRDKIKRDKKAHPFTADMKAPRLISLSELPPIYLHDFVPLPEADRREYGRGRRAKGEIVYDDGMNEEEWTSNIESGVDVDTFGTVITPSNDETGANPNDAASSVASTREIESTEYAARESVFGLKRERGSPAERSRGRGRGRGRPKSLPSRTDVSDDVDFNARKKARMGGVDEGVGENPPMETLDANERMKLQAIFNQCHDTVSQAFVMEELEEEEEENDKDAPKLLKRLRAELFFELPSRKLYPDYYQIILNPVAMDIITDRIDSNFYQSIQAFQSDFHVMFQNAMTYNMEGSVVYTDAFELKALLDDKLREICSRDDLIKNTSTSPQSKRTLSAVLDEEDQSKRVKTSMISFN